MKPSCLAGSATLNVDGTAVVGGSLAATLLANNGACITCNLAALTKNTNDDNIIGRTFIRSCTVNSLGTKLATITLCATGYMPLTFNDNNVYGCVYCGGFTSALGTNNDNTGNPIGYLKCTLPVLQNLAALNALSTVDKFNSLITNVVCDNAKSYFLTDINTCTQLLGFDSSSTTGIITKCLDGYYLSSTTKKCVLCNNLLSNAVGALNPPVATCIG